MELIGTVDRVQTELQFLEKYAERLRTRKKHGTLRAGRRLPATLTLSVAITETGEDLGMVVIDEVRWMKLKDIDTQEILRYEYPSNVRDLKKDLHTLYPQLTEDSWVTFFRFRFQDEGHIQE